MNAPALSPRQAPAAGPAWVQQAPWAPWALAAAAGALYSAPFVFTAAWPLQLALLAGLVLLLRLPAARPARRAFALGWLFGFAGFGSGVWWLFISLNRYGGQPAPMAAAAVAALVAVLALFPGAAAAVYAQGRRGRVGADALLFTALWLLADLGRGVLFTGFPWLATGYAQVDSPLAALAPWLGVYGVGAVAAGLAHALADLVAGRATRRAAAAVSVVGVALVALAAVVGRDGFTRPVGAPLGVTLVQTAVPQDQKFDAAQLPESLALLAKTLQESPSPLVVAPETAVPLLPFQLREFAPGYWESLARHFAAPGRAALVGVPLGDMDRGYTNSVAGLSAGPPYRYDKTHLVPFGEFVPWGFRWFTEALNIPLGDFDRGPLNAPSFEFAGQALAPNICYEDLFGEELARRFVGPGRAPTVMVNIGNIGWFGDTIAITQHLNISRFRTLELERPMLRATNTGATAAIDHRGHVTAQLPTQVRAVLQAQVQGREGLTPFAWWAGRWGLWPLLLAGVLGVAGPMAWRFRTR